MALARDWLKTLWSASYKGVPFFVEKDNEGGSRRIVEHEFPMRDRPFLEDLGEGVRRYNLTAYVVGNRADTNASSVMSICATRGPGILVLPTHGPILVRCLEFERDRDKDKHGYIAHRLRFSREGESTSLISSAILSNLTFVAVDRLALSIASSFARDMLSILQPDFVIDAAIDGLRDGVAIVEALRTSKPVDAVVSATQRNEIVQLYDAIPGLIEDAATRADAPARIVASMRAVVAAIDPSVAVSALEEIIQATPRPAVTVAYTYPTQGRRSLAINTEAAAKVARLAVVSAYCEAIALAPLADRPTALTLRGKVAEFLEVEIEAVNGADFDLYRSLTALRDATVKYLSKAILDLAPVRQIDANLEMPSLYWSWRFYKDPNRSTELAARNRVPHPSFIPPKFEALSE